MYTLYLSYNVNISALFLTGFLSGAFFAPFLGSAVDKFGRKNACIVYCVLEIIINVLEHSTNFHVLLLGRVLGGVSTNLLFSAFESWMTTEHRKHGFPEEWLSRTYAEVGIHTSQQTMIFKSELNSHPFLTTTEGFHWKWGDSDSRWDHITSPRRLLWTHRSVPRCDCTNSSCFRHGASLERELRG